MTETVVAVVNELDLCLERVLGIESKSPIRAKKSGSSNLPSHNTFDRVVVLQILRRVTSVMSFMETPTRLIRSDQIPILSKAASESHHRAKHEGHDPYLDRDLCARGS